MATFHVFGIPVTIGFDTDLIEKQDRYEQLYAETWDDEKPVEDWEDWDRKMTEQVKLFYELQDAGVDFSE